MTGDQLTLDDALREGRDLRDEGMARTEAADRDGIDKHIIDRAIDELNARGGPWSANDLRVLLPHVRQPLIGARVRAAATSKKIRRVGYVPSDLASTHGHPIACWVPNNSP